MRSSTMKRTFLFILSIFLCSIFLLNPAGAEDKKSGLPKEEVEKISELAHKLMSKAKLANGKELGEEKAKKLKYPLLPYQLREAIIARGTLSGFAKWCDLDWEKRLFEPMIDKIKEKNPKIAGVQLAYTGILHGVAMQLAIKNRQKAAKTCDAEFKANLDKKMGH